MPRKQDEPNQGKQHEKVPRDPRRALGAEGERRAAEFLRGRGYRILERNVRHGGVEIDLIVRRGSVVAFVEVKTRISTRFGAPELAVDARKQARMVRAAVAWRHGARRISDRIRFDVVSCRVVGEKSTRSWQIQHWPDAFLAGD